MKKILILVSTILFSIVLFSCQKTVRKIVARNLSDSVYVNNLSNLYEENLKQAIKVSFYLDKDCKLPLSVTGIEFAKSGVQYFYTVSNQPQEIKCTPFFGDSPFKNNIEKLINDEKQVVFYTKTNNKYKLFQDTRNKRSSEKFINNQTYFYYTFI